MDRSRLIENRKSVLQHIQQAAQRSGRPADAVRLVAVTKRRPVEQVAALVELGELNLGENYPQELWEKVEALPNPSIRWHLIGHLQGNKAKRTLPLVRLIHGVDSLKLLQTLDELAQGRIDPPGVCLQVNISAEASKYGWDEASLMDDSERISQFGSIPVLGLMTIAGYGTDNETARPTFARLRELRDRLRQTTGLALPELSMGMSNDFEAAIEEGSTLVRVGSALFEGV